jgi:hypothetical protein
MNYESTVTRESKRYAGVSFTVRRVSLGRRMELGRRIREIAAKVEVLEAGQDPKEKGEAALAAAEIERVYVAWGLAEVHGLEIDGQPATPERLIEAGPEELCREIAAAVKAECGLDEAERKN